MKSNNKTVSRQNFLRGSLKIYNVSGFSPVSVKYLINWSLRRLITNFIFLVVWALFRATLISGGIKFHLSFYCCRSLESLTSYFTVRKVIR